MTLDQINAAQEALDRFLSECKAKEVLLPGEVKECLHLTYNWYTDQKSKAQ